MPWPRLIFQPWCSANDYWLPILPRPLLSARFLKEKPETKYGESGLTRQFRSVDEENLVQSEVKPNMDYFLNLFNFVGKCWTDLIIFFYFFLYKCRYR